ncbi:hypothetical protein PspLS_01575 [Pyricularia sp. CBS 133598]|nr:hypothetical protein PspLS_01575 [Pyricularia sp. CBS 133598]
MERRQRPTRQWSRVGYYERHPTRLAELDRADWWRRSIYSDSNNSDSDHDRQMVHAGPPAASLRPKNARRRTQSPKISYVESPNQSVYRNNPFWDRETGPGLRSDYPVRIHMKPDEEQEHQTACNPDQPVNVHVHLQIPITLDLDEELGELARLRRVGDFRAAKTFFSSSKLAEHIGNPYVFVQYAELLLAMEDYNTIKLLQPPPNFGVSMEEEGIQWARREKRLNTDNSENLWLYSDPSDEQSLLIWNWILIKTLVWIHAEDYVFDLTRCLRSAFYYLEFGDDLGSTEVQIIVLCVKLYVAALNCASQLKVLASLGMELDAWVNCSNLFASLSTQNRHWDCSDLKAIDAIAFGYREDWNWKYNHPGRDRFDFRFTGPWEQLGHDEVSLLACLDQTTSIALALFTAKPHAIEHAERSVNMVSLMNTAAELLKRHYPAAMRSRPFIRWLILSSQAAGEKSDELRNLEQGKSWWGIFQSLAVSAGFVVICCGDGINLPIYVPRAIESPMWQALENPAPINEALHLALNLARDMDDYPTQAICYKLLALRSKEPGPLLESLCQLQEAHGDRLGYLKTLLSSYIGIDSLQSAKRLLHKLTDIRDTFSVHAHNRADIEVHWAHDVIKRALRGMIDRRHHQDTLGWVDADYIRHLPKKAWEFVDQVQAQRTSLVRHRSRRHDHVPALVGDTGLQRIKSAVAKREGSRPEEPLTNEAGSAEETLLEKKKRWSRQLAQLKAVKEAEMARTAALRKDNDDALPGDRQYPRRTTSPDDSSAAKEWDKAAAKDRQVILWKGDYRNHEQWLALNRGELDPAEYYRKWAVRNPDAVRAAWRSGSFLERDRERRDTESEPPPFDDSGDESPPEVRIRYPRQRRGSYSSSSDGEDSPDDGEARHDYHRDLQQQTGNPESSDHNPHVSSAPDSAAITHGTFTTEPAGMVTTKEAPLTRRQPPSPRRQYPNDPPQVTIVERSSSKPRPGSLGSPSDAQRHSVTSNEIYTRSRYARVDDDYDLDEPSTTRGSQDNYPYHRLVDDLPSGRPPSYRRYDSYNEQDTLPGAVDPIPKGQYASPRAVRWEDHERRRQNDRIGNRAPSVVASDGPSHAHAAEASAPPIAYSSRQPRVEPRRMRRSVTTTLPPSPPATEASGREGMRIPAPPRENERQSY